GPLEARSIGPGMRVGRDRVRQRRLTAVVDPEAAERVAAGVRDEVEAADSLQSSRALQAAEPAPVCQRPCASAERFESADAPSDRGRVAGAIVSASGCGVDPSTEISTELSGSDRTQQAGSRAETPLP